MVLFLFPKYHKTTWCTWEKQFQLMLLCIWKSSILKIQEGGHWSNPSLPHALGMQLEVIPPFFSAELWRSVQFELGWGQGEKVTVSFKDFSLSLVLARSKFGKYTSVWKYSRGSHGAAAGSPLWTAMTANIFTLKSWIPPHTTKLTSTADKFVNTFMLGEEWTKLFLESYV